MHYRLLRTHRELAATAASPKRVMKLHRFIAQCLPVLPTQRIARLGPAGGDELWDFGLTTLRVIHVEAASAAQGNQGGRGKAGETPAFTRFDEISPQPNQKSWALGCGKK